MLSETKQQLQEVTNKIQLLDFVITALNVTHPENKDKVDGMFKDISTHKIKLAEEVLRLARVME